VCLLKRQRPPKGPHDRACNPQVVCVDQRRAELPSLARGWPRLLLLPALLMMMMVVVVVVVLQPSKGMPSSWLHPVRGMLLRAQMGEEVPVGASIMCVCKHKSERTAFHNKVVVAVQW
jgi:hypothetical protein